MTRGTGIAGAMDYRPAGSEQPGRTCFVCGGEIKGGAAHAVRVLPPMVEACSEACASDPRFAQPWRAVWQPISTAPRDGRDILVWWPMRALDDEGLPTGEIVDGRAFVSAWVIGGYWWEPKEVEDGCDEEEIECGFTEEPSHWMPLPEPPAQEAGDA